MKKQFVFGLAVAVICLYFVFKGIAFGVLFHTLRHGKVAWIMLALVLYTFGYILRTIRWAILLEPVKPIAASSLFAPMAIGYFANNVLPFRVGELVRAHVTGKKFHISRTASLGTILLERLCDTLSFLTTFCVVALFFPFPALVEKGAMVLATGCFLVIGGLIFMTRHRSLFDRWVHRFVSSTTWRNKFFGVINKFSEGVGGIKNARYVVMALLLSLIVWVIEGTFLFLMARAFSVPLGYPQSFFVLFFMGLAVTLPQAPGYVGTLELFGVTALGLLSVPKQLGLSLILAVHGTQFIFVLVLGIWALWSEGLTFGNLIATSETA